MWPHCRVQNKSFSSFFQQETAVCYADFCDVFRCRGYLRLRQKSVKNHRGAFTRIWGGRQAFYDLGINLHTDLPAEDVDKTPKNALMTTASQQIINGTG